MHSLATQDSPVPQVLSQVPQCWASDCTFTQTPLHIDSVAGQVAGELLQLAAKQAAKTATQRNRLDIFGTPARLVVQ
jgi:hypothetical protein